MHWGPSGSAAEDTYRGAGLSGGTGVSGEADGALKWERGRAGPSAPHLAVTATSQALPTTPRTVSQLTPRCPSQPGTFRKRRRVWIT